MKKYLIFVTYVMVMTIFAAPRVKAPAPRLDELFGVKLGERIPEGARSSSSSVSFEGMVLAELKPVDPLLPFEDFAMVAVPKTRTVAVVLGMSTFDSKAHAEEAFNSYLGKLQRHYRRVFRIVDLREKSSAVHPIAGMEMIKVAVLMGKDERALLLKYAKSLDKGSPVVILQLTDLNATQTVEDKFKKMTKAYNVKLPGIFGVEFGEELDPEFKETTIDGALYAAFKPKKKFLKFREYTKFALPKTHRVFQITAEKEFDQKADALACYDKVHDLLEMRYKCSILDLTGGEIGEVNEDGDVLIQDGTIPFAENRTLEVSCWKTEDGLFKVVIEVEDERLSELLPGEVRATRRKRHAADLDAL